MAHRTILLQAGILLTCLLLSGCGGEPYAYQPDHELKPGPGLLSGADGEFTLLGTPETQESDTEPAPEEQPKK